MRRLLHSVQLARASAPKILLAALLSLSVAAKALPPEVLSAAHGCEMPCCQGEGAEAGGHAGESCHALLPEKSAHAAHAEHAPPEQRHAHEGGHAAEHSAGRDLSRRESAPRPSASRPRVSEPCPPDCGAALASFTQLRRADDDAALARKARPRTHANFLPTRAPDGATKTSSELRRLRPPRAPPSRRAGLSA